MIASPNAVPLTIGGELELVAAGHEDAGRRRRAAPTSVGVVGLLAALRPRGDDVGRARACGTARRTPRRPRARASDAVGITAIRASAPPASGDERLEDRAAAELVLGTADDA